MCSWVNLMWMLISSLHTHKKWQNHQDTVVQNCPIWHRIGCELNIFSNSPNMYPIPKQTKHFTLVYLMPKNGSNLIWYWPVAFWSKNYERDIGGIGLVTVPCTSQTSWLSMTKVHIIAVLEKPRTWIDHLNMYLLSNIK